MILLWLTTGVAAASSETPVVEQRGKGGSSKWRLQHEAETQADVPNEPIVSVETIQQAVSRKRRPTPAAPDPVAPVQPVATLPVGSVTTLFELPVPEVATPVAAPAPDVPETEETRRALGTQRIERTYDLELLLLMAA